MDIQQRIYTTEYHIRGTANPYVVESLIFLPADQNGSWDRFGSYSLAEDSFIAFVSDAPADAAKETGKDIGEYVRKNALHSFSATGKDNEKTKEALALFVNNLNTTLYVNWGGRAYSTCTILLYKDNKVYGLGVGDSSGYVRGADGSVAIVRGALHERYVECIGTAQRQPDTSVEDRLMLRAANPHSVAFAPSDVQVFELDLQYKGVQLLLTTDCLTDRLWKPGSAMGSGMAALGEMVKTYTSPADAVTQIAGLFGYTREGKDHGGSYLAGGKITDDFTVLALAFKEPPEDKPAPLPVLAPCRDPEDPLIKWLKTTYQKLRRHWSAGF